MLSGATPSLRVRALLYVYVEGVASREGGLVEPIVIIYPYRAHTAAEAVTGAFPGLSGDIVEKSMVKHTLGGAGGKGLLSFAQLLNNVSIKKCVNELISNTTGTVDG